MRRAPSLLVALGAAVAELVIVAAAGNQWIVDHLVKNARLDELPRDHELKATLTSFAWRFTSEHGDRMLWIGELAAVVGLVVVVFLVVLAFAASTRPPRGFVAVLLGTWGVVLGLSQLAAMGRVAIAYRDLFPHSKDPAGLGRFWYSIFGGPTVETVLFGGVSGLVVGLVAAILAAIGNRRAAAAADEEFTAVPAGGPREGMSWPSREADEASDAPTLAAAWPSAQTSGWSYPPRSSEGTGSSEGAGSSWTSTGSSWTSRTDSTSELPQPGSPPTARLPLEEERPPESPAP